jgi:hypothetical protein
MIYRLLLFQHSSQAILLIIAPALQLDAFFGCCSSHAGFFSRISSQ